MVNIQTLISDLEMEKELLKCIKRRSIEQKFIYLGNNAEKFYTTKGTSKVSTLEYWQHRLTREQRIQFIKNLIDPKSRKIAIMSLGCGNANIECDIMESFKDQPHIRFFGVDSSKEMLLSAQKLFQEKSLQGQFLCADFTSSELREEIRSIQEQEHIDQTIFLFVGGTIGNVAQTEIVDTLYNLLNERDTLYLDIALRKSLDKSDDLKVFSAYTSMLENQDRIAMYSNALSLIGIPREHIKPTLRTVSEQSIGVLRFDFFMEILTPTVISYRGEKIHLLPSEEIKFLEIRTYHPETFVSFYHQHGLGLIDQEITGYHGQFAFKKKNA